MSTKPSKWVSKVLPFSDVVYVHGDINKDLRQVIDEIRNMGKLVGIALKSSSEIKNYINVLQKADYVLLLTIENPGNSGQNFQSSAFKKLTNQIVCHFAIGLFFVSMEVLILLFQNLLIQNV